MEPKLSDQKLKITILLLLSSNKAFLGWQSSYRLLWGARRRDGREEGCRSSHPDSLPRARSPGGWTWASPRCCCRWGSPSRGPGRGGSPGTPPGGPTHTPWTHTECYQPYPSRLYILHTLYPQSLSLMTFSPWLQQSSTWQTISTRYTTTTQGISLHSTAQSGITLPFKILIYFQVGFGLESSCDLLMTKT